MLPDNPTSSAPKKAVTPRHALLETLIEIVGKQIGDQFLAFSTELAGQLVDMSDVSLELKEVQARIRAGNLLRSNHYALLNLYSKQLEKDVRFEIAQLAPGAKTAVRKMSEPLSLVSMEEMDNKVTMGSVSKPFEVQYSDQLATLNVRLAFLLDRDILRTNQNPFRPEVLLNAFQQAWTDFVEDEECSALLIPMLKPDNFFNLAPMLEALNLGLERNNVLPGSVEKQKSRRADSHDASAAPSRKKNQQAALAEQLRQFFAGGEAPGSNAPSGFDALGDLDLSLPTMDVAPGLYGSPSHTAGAGVAGAPPSAAMAARMSAQVGGGAAPAMGMGMAAAYFPGMMPAAGGAMPMGGVPYAGAMNAMGGMAPGLVMNGAAAASHMMAGIPAGGLGIQVPMASGQGIPGGLMSGVAVPGVQGGVAVPAGGWTHGPAQGFNGGANNEEAQRQSLLGVKEPLLNYLAQLHRSVPMGGFVSAEAAGSGGATPAAGFMQAPMDASMAMPAGAFTSGNFQPGSNVFILPQIKENAPQGSLSRADEGTIDLLSAVFETVFRDQSISPEIRNLIRFLQIPVLKAALVDKNFFFQEAHPARRMIDLLSRMGWENHKDPSDPLYQAMQKSVDRVSSDYEKEVSVFTEAVNELEASIKAEEAAEATAMAEPIAKALKQEKMAVAGKSAKDAIALRIGTGEVVAVVEAFLENKWVDVLTVAYSVEEEKPGAVKNATQTMDDLIWSVRPKISAEDRKKLIAKLPSLLSTLNKWLDVVKWQDADRLHFFAQLAECHASIVRAPLELSPERQLEISMEVARKDMERRLELQAKAEAEAKAKAEAMAREMPDEDDDATIEVDSLVRGMWLDFKQDDGSSRKVKLAWISPLKTLYIFSTSSRQEAFSLSGEAMAQQFREGKVTLIRTEGVVAHALSIAMGGAVNDDQHDLPANGTHA